MHQNAHKHWISGWFDNRTETVNQTALPRDGNERRLVSFVDYDDDTLFETDVVLISVDDLYIQYDVPKGYNIHSLSRANVLITQANDTMSRSVAVANLSIGQSFTYQKYSETDNSTGIVIEVCNTGSTNDSVDYSIISIYLNDGEQLSTCEPAENSTVSSTSPTFTVESFVPSTFDSSVPSDVPNTVPTVPNRKTAPTATMNVPSPSRATLVPSDERFATSGPARNNNPSSTQTSGGILRFPASILSTLVLSTPMIMQHFVRNW